MKHAVEWAEARGLSRDNPVHGKKEYRVPTQWNFSNSDIDRTKTTASSSAELEAWGLLDVAMSMCSILT